MQPLGNLFYSPPPDVYNVPAKANKEASAMSQLLHFFTVVSALQSQFQTFYRWIRQKKPDMARPFNIGLGGGNLCPTKQYVQYEKGIE